MIKISQRNDDDYILALIETRDEYDAKADKYSDPSHPDRHREMKEKYWRKLARAYDGFIEAARARKKQTDERKSKVNWR